jgi:hypothetical protein
MSLLILVSLTERKKSVMGKKFSSAKKETSNKMSPVEISQSHNKKYRNERPPQYIFHFGWVV